MRHVLTMAVGVGLAVRIRYYALELRDGDLLMLSTDGLHGVVEKKKMEAILARPQPLDRKCQELVDAAHEAGSPDNVTVVLIRATDRTA
jgi:protein phosphatase